MERSGYGMDGVYRSLLPPLAFPKDPNLSLVSYLFQKSDDYPNKLALADAISGEGLTFAQFKSMVQSVSHGLSKLGIKKGDVVLIFAPNSIHFPVCFLAIAALGAVATTVNPLYTIAEITKQVHDSCAKLAITIPQLWDKIKGLGLPAVLLGTKNSEASTTNVPTNYVTYFSDLLELGGDKSEFPSVSIKQSDMAALMYSSGTTGMCKGVILNHRSFISAAAMATSDQDLNGDGQNVFLCFLPMFHIVGLVVITYGQLTRGNSVFTMKKFNLEMLLKSVEKYGVTHLYAVPPVIIALSKQKWGEKYNLSSLKRIASGAAPLGTEVMKLR